MALKSPVNTGEQLDVSCFRFSMSFQVSYSIEVFIFVKLFCFVFIPNDFYSIDQLESARSVRLLSVVSSEKNEQTTAAESRGKVVSDPNDFDTILMHLEKKGAFDSFYKY